MIQEIFRLYAERSSFFGELILQHIRIAGISVAISLLLGLVIGVLISEFRKPAQIIMNIINVLYTIPSISMLGFLMLIGTVVNNGILYVETVNQLLAEMPLDQALVEAGAIRMRPIFMTTLTTVISMVPNALAYGKAGAMMQGLALVNVGGLIAATALTLIMLPTYYKLVYNLGRKSLGLDEENISD